MTLLNSKQVKYLLIGGYAVGYHGYPRATNDMDIWIAVDSINAEKLVSALDEFGFRQPDLSKQLFLEHNKVIRMGVAPMRIELLTSISGIEFDESYQRKLSDNIDGVPVQIISLQDLKINKKSSGRYKDLDDLENLP